MLENKIAAMYNEITSMTKEQLDYEVELRKMEIQALQSQLLNLKMAGIIVEQAKLINILTERRSSLEKTIVDQQETIKELGISLEQM